MEVPKAKLCLMWLIIHTDRVVWVLLS